HASPRLDTLQFFSSSVPPPPNSTLFPYTTLFRSKRELALAAALRLLDSHPVPTPDTGSLRGDVLELLTVANGSRARLGLQLVAQDRKSTRLNSSHVKISYAVFCLKKKKKKTRTIN